MGRARALVTAEDPDLLNEMSDGEGAAFLAGVTVGLRSTVELIEEGVVVPPTNQGRASDA